MARFTSGNKASVGVPKPGRPPDWLKEKCQGIVDKEQLVELLGAIARGDDMEQVVTDNGEVLQVPASVKERLKAIEMLLNRGFGKVDADAPAKSPDDSVIAAAQAARLLKELEAYSAKGASK